MHSISDILTKIGLSSDKLAQHKTQQDDLQSLFDQAVANSYATEHCRVVSLLENRLYVDVDHPTWYAYMRYNTKEVKNKLSQHAICKDLKEIILRRM